MKRLPLGVSSTFRYWGDDRTIYVDHGKGGRTWDIDGNCYVDYRLGYGPAILGYADDRVDAAARRGMEVGGVFALSTERELIVADRIAKMVPAAELVRFSNSGTEAVMAALRLARAHTGRDSYLLVEGGYHGLFDAAMWMANMDEWDHRSNRDPEIVSYGKGIPRTLKDLAHLVPMNDCERLEDIFKQSRQHACRHADRAHPGQLLRDLGRSGIRETRPRALHQIWGIADHRRGEDRFPRRQGRDPGHSTG